MTRLDASWQDCIVRAIEIEEDMMYATIMAKEMAYQAKEDSQSLVTHTLYPVESRNELKEVKDELVKIKEMLASKVQQMNTSKNQGYVTFLDDGEVRHIRMWENLLKIDKLLIEEHHRIVIIVSNHIE